MKLSTETYSNFHSSLRSIRTWFFRVYFEFNNNYCKSYVISYYLTSIRQSFHNNFRVAKCNKLFSFYIWYFRFWCDFCFFGFAFIFIGKCWMNWTSHEEGNVRYVFDLSFDISQEWKVGNVNFFISFSWHLIVIYINLYSNWFCYNCLYV